MGSITNLFAKKFLKNDKKKRFFLKCKFEQKISKKNRFFSKIHKINVGSHMGDLGKVVFFMNFFCTMEILIHKIHDFS